MAASLEGKFSEATTITPGSSGQFDVFINDQLVFSKAETGRFPVEGEVEAMFEAIRDGRELPGPIDAPKPSSFVHRMIDKLRN